MAQRIGVMGGTFNPVHIGHLRAAEEALEMLGLDVFLFAPAADPPHKPLKSVLPFERRWEMLRIATEGHPLFQLSDIERRLAGKSYTVRTLGRLHEEIPGDTELYFLMGLDAFLEVDTWWRYKELFELSRIVILRRPGYPERCVEQFLHEKVSGEYRWNAEEECFQDPRLLPVYYLEVTFLGISSTQIRCMVGQKRSIRYLVPDGVMRYIKETSLYGEEVCEIPGKSVSGNRDACGIPLHGWGTVIKENDRT